MTSFGEMLLIVFGLFLSFVIWDMIKIGWRKWKR